MVLFSFAFRLFRWLKDVAEPKTSLAFCLCKAIGENLVGNLRERDTNKAWKSKRVNSFYMNLTVASILYLYFIWCAPFSDSDKDDYENISFSVKIKHTGKEKDTSEYVSYHHYLHMYSWQRRRCRRRRRRCNPAQWVLFYPLPLPSADHISHIIQTENHRPNEWQFHWNKHVCWPFENSTNY